MGKSSGVGGGAPSSGHSHPFLVERVWVNGTGCYKSVIRFAIHQNSRLTVSFPVDLTGSGAISSTHGNNGLLGPLHHSVKSPCSEAQFAENVTGVWLRVLT